MAYAVPDGGILQVVFSGLVLNQQMLTVLHYQLEKPGGLDDGALAMDAVRTQINLAGNLGEAYYLCLSNQYTQGRLRLQWILPTRFAYKEYLPSTTEGQAAADVLAPNMAVAINKRSEFAGVHSRGVTHMPAVPSTFITGGNVNAGGLLAYADLGTQLKADLVTIGSGTYHPIIFNRATPGDIVRVTNFTVDATVRTMHRRTVGLGA